MADPTGFVKNKHRYDPYKNFKFQISWDGKVVLGVSKVGALKRTTEVVKHRSGGQNSFDHKSPGRTSYEGISIERGLTHERRRRAVIQLASSLRNVGDAEESVALLSAELEQPSDELDDAVRGFLALALADVGRERDALSHALTALAPHLPRYQRSLAAYAAELSNDAN